MKKNVIYLSIIILTTIFYSSSSNAQKVINRSLSVERTERQLSLGKGIENPDGGPGIGGIGAGYNPDNDDDSNNIDGFGENMTRQIREINARRAAENGNGRGVNSNYQNNLPRGISALQDTRAILGNTNTQNQRPTFKSGLPPTSRGQNQQNIISVFCGNKYRIKTNTSKAEIICINTMRQQACERFKRSTINVQRILSKSINCESNISGYNLSGCDGLNTSRLDLLKQYWQDESTSYTILFLPDMVLNAAANCAASTRGRTTR